MTAGPQLAMTRVQIATIMRVTAGVHCALFQHDEEWDLCEAVIRAHFPAEHLARILRLADLAADAAAPLVRR